MAFAGWLFDAYPTADGIAVWLIGDDGRPHRLTVPFAPAFYAAGPKRALERLAPALAAARIPVETAMVLREELLSGAALPVLQIAVQQPAMFPTAVRVAARLPGVSLFDCDLSVPQLFFAQTGLFPLGYYRVREVPGSTGALAAAGRTIAPAGASVAAVRDFQPLSAPNDLEYALPPLLMMRLRLDGDPIDPTHTRRTELEVSVDGESVVLCGERPEDLVGSLNRLFARYDPDVILTEWGDGYLMPRLQMLAQRAGLPLRWNRETHQGVRTRRARSYMTYGQTVYTASAHMLFGRWHLDLRNSFIYGESELPGLLEIARLARLPVQYEARTSIGTAISAMQLVRAIQRGILIPWHKSEPEMFKSAEELLITDKGGLTYQPIVGMFEHVGELDFSSMYPTIMARFNVSPETMNCSCCPDAPRVPETGARLCQRRKGLVPEVLEPLLARRAYYKRRKRETAGAERALYQQRQTALKWCLVCCLDGNTMVLHRTGGIWQTAPIRKIVEAYLPGDSCGQMLVEDLAVIGLDGDLRGCVKPVKAVIKTPAPSTMIRMRVRWGRELLMTPNHRCYVLRKGRLEVKRADQVVVGDWIPLALSTSEAMTSEVDQVDLLRALKALPLDEQERWRVFGRPVRRIVQARYREFAARARDEYAAKTIWNWREYGYLPLSLVDPEDLPPEESGKLSMGRGKLTGGIIQRVPARIEIDEDLGFLLGFYVGDGSATGKMVRFAVGANEREHLTRLRDILKRKFGLRSRSHRERKARMYILQVNSVALIQVLKDAFGLGGAADRDKLRVPEVILNGPAGARRGFILGLLASDGSVSRVRNFAGVVSASRELIAQLGVLFVSLGIDYRFTIQGHLYGIQTRNLSETLQVLYDGAPVSRKHLRALSERQRRSRCVRAPQIPVVASGLLHLCRTVRVARVPRISGQEMISKNLARLKIQQVLERVTRNGCGMPESFRDVRCLVESPLIFSPVISVEKIPYDSPYVYCFELTDDPTAFFVEGGILTSNSFGYLGYRNARFGRIEAHEATTAFSREMLLRAKEIAEGRGYRMLHALVDSMWLHRPGAGRDDYEALALTIERETDLPIFVEGVYDWISFLPSRTHPGVGVPNRYVGRFDDGTSKVRGIEVRRSDVPAIVERTQQQMLDVLFGAATLAEVWQRIPRLLDILAETVLRLRDGEVLASELAITTTVSRAPAEYKNNAVVAVAARQMAHAGVHLHPGERIQYIITDADAHLADDRVRPLGLLGPDWSYDAEYYAELLVRTTETLLGPLGYTAARLEDEVRIRITPPATPAGPASPDRSAPPAPGHGC